MKKISFIILSWNSEKYLKNCIESVLNISDFEIEIFLIDNGSRDNSVKIAKSLKSNKIKIITFKKNYGTTISRNTGLKKIENTDYVCILDSDTIVNEDAFKIMIDYLDSHENAGIVGPSMENDKGDKQIPYRKFPTWKIKLLKACPIKSISKKGELIENYDPKSITDTFSCDYLISACWLMRYSTYKKLGDLDEKIFYSPEDVEYCMRARMKGFDIVHLRKAKIIHLYQRISKKKLISKANITHFIGIGYVLRKYKKFLKKYYKEKGVV